MDRDYAASYRRLYEEHWWWRSREAILTRLLRRIAPREGWGRILDVGCGDGLFFPVLQRWGEVEGVEPDAAAVTAAGRTSGRIHLVKFDEQFHPAHKYGLILMLDVLEHLDNPDAAIRRASELMEPGGLLLATVPSFDLIWTRHDDLNRHRTRYTRSRFEALLTTNGFTPRRSQYGFQALFFAKLLTRGMERFSKKSPQVPTVPPRILNAVLTAWCSVEHRIAGPLRVPFGSSLICVSEVSAPSAPAVS